MMKTSVERSVRLVAYLAVAALCLVRFYSVFDGLYHGKEEPLRRTAELVGQRVALPEGNAVVAGATVLVAMTTTCVYCQVSHPFYRRVVEEAASIRKESLRVIAMMPEDHEKAESYLASAGLKFDSVVRRIPGLRITATPTVLLINRSGTIEKAWIGVLRPSDERELLSAALAAAGS